MSILWQPRLFIRGALSLAAVSGTAFLLTRRKLNQKCRRIPLSTVPKSSACRNFVEIGERTNHPAWGLSSSTLLPSWPGDNTTPTHWIPSFTAVQVELPISLLTKDTPQSGTDLLPLVKTLFAAFLSSPVMAFERWLMNRGVPPLSFTPGQHLFGTAPNPGAFLLGTWSSASGQPLNPLLLPDTAPNPVAAFPSNKDVLQGRNGEGEAAGLVLYWRGTGQPIQKVNRVIAAVGLPWQVMQGGFQEFIIERMEDSKEMVRVTYVSVEAQRMDPGGGGRRNFGRLPWVLMEMHVMYAQSLLWGAVGRLGR